jgi:hypothetical protein
MATPCGDKPTGTVVDSVLVAVSMIATWLAGLPQVK